MSGGVFLLDFKSISLDSYFFHCNKHSVKRSIVACNPFCYLYYYFCYPYFNDGFLGGVANDF